MLHFLQRKNVKRHTFYSEKCDEVEYSGISDNFFDMKNVLNEFF